MSPPAESPPPSQEPGASSTSPERNPPSKASKFRWRTVLSIVIPVAVLALAAVAVTGFVDMDVVIGNLTRPALVPAAGEALYLGQPLLNGQIATQPLNGRGAPALGWTDAEGKFTLKTDIRGQYVDGVTVGEHRVTVTAYQPGSGASAPALLTPAQYASMGTSPLRITISRNPGDNQFKFDLEGDPPARPERPTKGKQDIPDEQ